MSELKTVIAGEELEVWYSGGALMMLTTDMSSILSTAYCPPNIAWGITEH